MHPTIRSVDRTPADDTAGAVAACPAAAGTDRAGVACRAAVSESAVTAAVVDLLASVVLTAQDRRAEVLQPAAAAGGRQGVLRRVPLVVQDGRPSADVGAMRLVRQALVARLGAGSRAGAASSAAAVLASLAVPLRYATGSWVGRSGPALAAARPARSAGRLAQRLAWGQLPLPGPDLAARARAPVRVAPPRSSAEAARLRSLRSVRAQVQRAPAVRRLVLPHAPRRRRSRPPRQRASAPQQA